MFNQPTRRQWIFRNSTRASAIFAVGEVNYEFNANWQGGDLLTSKHWWLSFSLLIKMILV